MKRKIFSNLFKHAKYHYGHGKLRVNANIFFNSRIAVKYLLFWKDKAIVVRDHRIITENAQKRMR